MKNKLSSKFYVSLAVFSLVGQVAWVVENMYFNVFIYKMFYASASSISLMVQASAAMATVTTLIIGALSDKVGSRKPFIVGGYILWGLSILSFAFIRMDILIGIAGTTAAAAALGCNLVIIMDCVMTFFGSSANDACFNAWLTDMGDDSNRGSIEGINAMMPLVAILVVFGGFMAFDLNEAASWKAIYFIIGFAVIVVGILGIFMIDDSKSRQLLKEAKEQNSNYFANIIYGFRPSVIKDNKLLYIVLGAYAIFGISIQIYMPYLILYYEQTLHMANYVIVMAPAIILAAVATAFYGKVYDKVGFESSVLPTVISLMIGYAFLYFFKSTPLVFVGTLFMLTGYLSGMAVFGAMIRDNIPAEKSGLFQGLRIFGQVFIPGIIGPAIGAAVLKNAEKIVNSDGTESFIPNANIYLAAFIAAVVLIFALLGISEMRRKGHYNLTMDEEIGEIPFKSYPRPMLKRDSYISLNGKWDDNILIPFPLESELSGFKGLIPQFHTYTRSFTIPEDFIKDKVILHFQAVDQHASVYVDDKKVAEHSGGYLPFDCDITSFGPGQHILKVEIKDLTSHIYPYGKQTIKRGGMWYTTVSGIWQSVWMESLPKNYIENIKITPGMTSVHIEVFGGAEKVKVEVFDRQIPQQGNCILEREFGSKVIDIEMDNPKLWSPDEPNLYGLRISSGEDVITSYFALREISVKEINGKKRLCLNGEPYFFHAVLDQGYYPQGIFLPNNESGYERDILNMKELGINTLRKHIKIEPACFYEACDRLGMLVFQDMVNNGKYSFIRDTALPTLGMKKVNDSKLHVHTLSRQVFEKHTKDTLEHLYNYPCIVYYTIFNEGWGQFESDRMYEMVKGIDSTRIIDSTSGWFKQSKTDVESTHCYFHPIFQVPSDKPIVVSEMGGYSLKIAGHSYSKYTNYGYKNYADSQSLTDDIIKLYHDEVFPYISLGLCGTVYTQVSDVEDETNGFYTYDRAVCKVDKEKMKQLSRDIIEEYKKI